MWAAAMQSLVHLVYPPRCLACGGLVETDYGLCAACWGQTPFIAGLSCEACGLPLPGESGQAENCDDCLTTARPWEQGRAALLYKDTARRLVLALKHGDRHDIAAPAARWMAAKAEGIVTPQTLIAPVPLHLMRLVKRRYNQSALLAEELAKALSLEWCPDLLERLRHTPALDGMGKDARFAALSGRIALNRWRANLVQGRPVLLVDDVMTSGATLAACAEACLASGAARVSICVMARVAKEDYIPFNPPSDKGAQNADR